MEALTHRLVIHGEPQTHQVYAAELLALAIAGGVAQVVQMAAVGVVARRS